MYKGLFRTLCSHILFWIVTIVATTSSVYHRAISPIVDCGNTCICGAISGTPIYVDGPQRWALLVY